MAFIDFLMINLKILKEFLRFSNLGIRSVNKNDNNRNKPSDKQLL